MLGIAFCVYSYANLLRSLRWRHRGIYEELGRPRLFMVSPDHSIRLQKFIFSRRALDTGDRELNATVRFLRVFTIVLVSALIGGSIALILAATGVL